MLKLKISLILLVMTTHVFTQEDWANLKRYKLENEALKPLAKNEKRVVFMGNSITEGWVYSQPNFFTENNFIGRGISGQTTDQMLLRFRQDVINIQPKVVVILAGTNDIAGNNGPVTLEMIMNNIKSMSELAIQNHINIILCSVLPANDYPWKPGMEPAHKIIELNKMIKKYADEKHLIYCNFYDTMVNEALGLKKELGEDGVHPNEKGYTLMNEIVLRSIKKAMRK
jgi:lysophospholipase L1-like esterase